MADLRPDREALLSWLVSPRVVRANGEVLSWWGPGAFAYPEAGGLLLRLLAQERVAKGCADAIATWLAQAIDEGRVGRAGRSYTFDLAAVVGGLQPHVVSRARPVDAIASAFRKGELAVADALAVARAVDAPASERWSTQFGPHMRKVAHFLRYDPRFRESGLDPLWRATGGDAFDPYAPTPGATATYLHACLYALEGTAVLAAARGRADCVAAAMAWLARLQRPDGGLPAWADGERGFGPTRADTTAQAVRLWAWLDAREYADAIARGLAWPARATVPGRGVRYSDDCEHQNTWATIFAIQALDFAEGRLEEVALL